MCDLDVSNLCDEAISAGIELFGLIERWIDQHEPDLAETILVQDCVIEWDFFKHAIKKIDAKYKQTTQSSQEASSGGKA